MEEFVTYILYSTKYDKIYIGYSSSIVQRFYSHNYFSKKGYTLKYRTWKVLEVEFHNTKKQAMKREKFLKSGKDSEYFYELFFPKDQPLGFTSFPYTRLFQSCFWYLNPQELNLRGFFLWTNL